MSQSFLIYRYSLTSNYYGNGLLCKSQSFLIYRYSLTVVEKILLDGIEVSIVSNLSILSNKKLSSRQSKLRGLNRF